MKDTVFLVTDSSGVVRMTKRAPSLYRNEVAVRLTVQVPDSAYRSLQVSATLDVPEERVILPEIEVDVAEPDPDAEARV